MDEAHIQALEVRALSGILTKLAAQDLERRLQARRLDVSALQFGVLRRLERKTATISELSTSMHLAPATLVPVVDALEQKGLIRRITDTDDRRRKSLAVTPPGEAIIAQMPDIVRDDQVAGALTAIGHEDAGKLIDLLGQVVTLLSADPEIVVRIRANIRAQRG